MRVRVKFTKEGRLKYIGHLDLMRYFQKAIRRAGFDVTYSGGFSPHMIMSFAAPLGVGLTSTGEYFDLDLNTAGDLSEMTERLDREMAPGIHVLQIREIPQEKAAKAMRLVESADYRVTLRVGFEALRDVLFDADLIRRYLAQEVIPVEKRTKKGTRTIDIRPLIETCEVREGALFLAVSQGSKDNLRPEYVVQTLAAFAGIPLPEGALLIHRLELYTRIGSDDAIRRTPLGELGEELVSASDYRETSEYDR